ncbi:MAG: hypothetical protein P8M34_09095 [Saprospiraceae bacterium]|nr:hypothetical protein [Saprospiraceae bacterium]
MIHLALGQSYHQTGAQNESLIHWEFISDMTNGSVYADGKMICKNGKFIIGSY